MNDRPSGGERVVLVHIDFSSSKMEENLDEFKELVASVGADSVAIITGARRVPDSKYFVGSGKAAEIRDMVLANQAELVIFNHNLTPAQERNLEQLLKCRVVDRTDLILDIFAQRARSFEGQLQVELAQLKHLSTRLVRGWTHLERQRGGIGLRGPGETQLETDRRLVRNRIKTITARLEKLHQQRELGRRARRKAVIPTVALVGYTNAGKSSLFNRLTGADVYVANQLFATLDPTLRRVVLPEAGAIILADTVGFIRHLPHDLVEAFHATLEEVSEADLLLHVIDAADQEKQTHIEQVNHVLESIHAETVPRLMVYNKIDLVQAKASLLHSIEAPSPQIERDEFGGIKRVLISATANQGMAALSEAISEMLGKEMVEQVVILSPQQAKLRAELYAREAVLAETIDDEGNCHLRIRLPRVEFRSFR